MSRQSADAFANVHDLPQPFTPFYPSSMTGLPPPPPEWVVDGVILRGSVCLLTGNPGTGKSLLTQQLLTAASLGRQWLDKETVAVKTFGVFSEDAQIELERRQLDINAYYDADPGDYEMNYAWESRDAKDSVIWTHDSNAAYPKKTAFWEQIWGFIKESGTELLVLDTVAVVFGGNENWRNHVTPFMRELTRMAIQCNVAIILTSHPSRQSPNGYSGSSAWLGSSRFAYNLGRPKEYDPDTGEPRFERVIRTLKANYSAGITAEKLRWHRGVFIPDAIEDEKPKGAPVSRLDRIELRVRLLEGLKRTIENGGKVFADELSGSSLAARARRSPDASINRIPLNDLYAAQAELIRDGHVTRVLVGGRCLLRPAGGPSYVGEAEWKIGM